MNIKEKLRTGVGAASLASAWAVFDAIVHVLVDKVELLRITGNIIVWVALVISLVTARVAERPRFAGLTCAVAALLVLAVNVVWAVDLGELPVVALIFFGLAIVLLLVANRRFSAEAEGLGAE